MTVFSKLTSVALYTATLALTFEVAFPSSSSNAPPNVVFILTDDQDVTLNSLSVMPQVQSLLTSQGTYFSNAFATTPICCPSRAEIITGRHMHNTKVTGNDCGGMDFRKGPEQLNVATYAKVRRLVHPCIALQVPLMLSSSYHVYSSFTICCRL